MSGTWADKLKGWWLGAGRFLREVYAEVNPKTGKVHWPTRPQVVSSTIVVVVIVVIASAYLWGLDYVFGNLRTLLVNVR